ncbi:hypothetical protein Taro_040458 [Colocasia esculenta]|uniref:Nudix hydrolase domain-containing protein n=1 Tax=Colocasia esculenta TaxID=4460 RepID=A0A843WLY8_COLES|nr:hypothetical protein [Colocasia esculenta]
MNRTKRTLPAGFLEVGESAVEGAVRETLEEAHAEVEVISPFAQLDIPVIGHIITFFSYAVQSYVIFRAKLKKPHFSPGPESLECALFSLDEIPFDSLAFSSVIVTLKLYTEDVRAGSLKFHYCHINKRYEDKHANLNSYINLLLVLSRALLFCRPGSSPSDPHGFSLDGHLNS